MTNFKILTVHKHLRKNAHQAWAMAVNMEKYNRTFAEIYSDEDVPATVKTY